MTTRRKKRPACKRIRTNRSIADASGNDDDAVRASKAVRSLAKTKQEALRLLSDAVNRHKPAGALVVSPDSLVDASMVGELRWQVDGWTVHLFLEASKPIEICWCSPDGAIFNIGPTKHRRFASSIDSGHRLRWTGK